MNNVSERAQSLLSELGQYIGIDKLAFDEGGLCTLAFDEEIIITLIASDENLSAVCYITDNVADSVLPRLLEANFAWGDTGGGTFSLEPSTRRVMLSRNWGLSGLTFQQFSADLELVVNSCEAWQKRLKDPQDNDPSDPAPTEANNKNDTTPHDAARFV